MQKYLFSLPFNGTKNLSVDISIDDKVTFSFCFDRKHIFSEPAIFPFPIEESEKLLERLDLLLDFSLPKGISILLGFSFFQLCKNKAGELPSAKAVINFIREAESSLLRLDKAELGDKADPGMYLDGLHDYAEKFEKINPLRATFERVSSDFDFIDETRTIIYKNQRIDFTKSTSTYDRLKCLIQELIRRKGDLENKQRHYISGSEMDAVFDSYGISKSDKNQFTSIFRDETLEKIGKFAQIENNRFFLK